MTNRIYKGMLGLLLLLTAIQTTAQPVLNKQRHFRKTVPAGNYSGVTWMGGDRYAVIDDKSATAGFWLFTVSADTVTGSISHVRADSFMTAMLPNRDEEGICYVPATNTLFVSGESDGRILEYTADGQPTGRQLDIPAAFDSVHRNYGLEALTYNATTHRFWTTTENTLTTDGQRPDIRHKTANRLRLQSFGDDLRPLEQYWYLTDSLAAKGRKGSSTLGVSAMAALDDGRLVILEREVRVPRFRIGSYVRVKLYIVTPTLHQPGEVLGKQLLAEFRTKLNLTRRSFANYEGLCAGPRLADGRQLLLLVADSQNRYKHVLKDWFKTIVMSPSSM